MSERAPASLIRLAPGHAGVVHRVERRVHPLQQLLRAGLVHVKGKGRALVCLHVPRCPAESLRLQQACARMPACEGPSTWVGLCLWQGQQAGVAPSHNQNVNEHPGTGSTETRQDGFAIPHQL